MSQYPATPQNIDTIDNSVPARYTPVVYEQKVFYFSHNVPRTGSQITAGV